MSPFIVRGFLIGSSVGIFAVLLGFVNTAEGIVFGATMGLLAGLTSAKLYEKRMKDKANQNKRP
ncbi:hypothetical protein [uncultured Mailhella sp.]|uniref:hypothetical protein n=1 Tax=uncultured Mailhella sp. TaxID=1981031 RepID=UPI0025E6E319|nr:hypothetical protein [uncultured Mailhella sp.]